MIGSEVIGEGTYGCVHKPSLKCKDSTGISYDKKVSKLLKTTDANKEIKEYNKVKDIDLDKEYYLGVPDACDIDIRSVVNLKSIQKCKIGSEAIKNLSKYKLLIMGDGGINLEQYTKKMKNWSVSEMSTELCEKFVLESLRLFKGLKVFEQHGLVHHDLKPQNIVYNEQENRLNYIDFGLMASRKKIVSEAKESKYEFGIFHWSYPWELEFIDKTTFDEVVTDPEYQNQIIQDLNKEISEKKGKYQENANTFFYFALNRYAPLPEYQENCAEYIRGYERTIKENMAEMKYQTFVDSSVRTIDVFGLGISMNYWYCQAKRFLPDSLAEDLKVLYGRMIEPELKFRPFINEVMKSMEEILIKHDLLNRYNKKIVNGIVVDSNIELPVRAEIDESIFEKVKEPNRKLLLATPGECPEGKVRNEKGRCVKIKAPPIDKRLLPCPEGKMRNENGRCVKIKAAPVNKMDLPCPEGKERNPKTRRCVAKCKPGYTRDENFKCIKNKTSKNRTVKI
jgi:serine/threonine protein kinase